MAPAWRRVQRQRLDNVLLVVARAEELPPALAGAADATTVHFPWGSLLRGVLEREAAVAGGLARITKPGGSVTVVLSVTDHERALGLPVPDERLGQALAGGYAAHGLTLVEWRPATGQEVEATRSSWAKRLDAGGRRPAWLLRLTRDGTHGAEAWAHSHSRSAVGG
jgi:16S rRNA (adenine(1408)-N(1))-methyltransferase